MGYYFWMGKEIRAKSNPQRMAHAWNIPLSAFPSDLEMLMLEAWLW